MRMETSAKLLAVAGALLLLAGVIFGMLGQWLYAALVWAGGLGFRREAHFRKNVYF